MSRQLTAAMRADHLRRVELPATAAAFDALREQRDALLKILSKRSIARFGPREGVRTTRDDCVEAGIDLNEGGKVLGFDLEA